MIDVRRVGGAPDPAKWNFFANVMDGALYAFGLSLVSQQTVLPVLVKNIGGGNVAVGLIPVLWIFGFNVPQIFIAGRAELLKRKKSLLLWTSMGQRLPWFFLAVATYAFFGRIDAGAALVIFFALYGLAALGGSINLPVWFDLIAKLTPVRVRGRLFGVRSILGAGLGILGGGIVTYVLGAVGYPANFSMLLLLAFLSMMSSYLFLVSLRETHDSAPPARGHAVRSFRGLPGILRARKNYRNFLIADALQIAAGMGAAFFTVHALTKFDLPDAEAGTFTIVMMSSMIAGSLLFGLLADRFGHRVNLLVSAAATVAACGGALLAPGRETYLCVFVFSALTSSLGVISRLPFMAELCSEEDRPTLVALANMITAPFVLSGVIAGWAANSVGYEPVFIVAGCLGLVAFLWLSMMVKEPRRMTA